jgi:hypothetical protein
MRKRLLLSLFALYFSSTNVFAATRVEEAVRLSKLTLSAMQCAHLATDSAEAQRLADVGVAAGKNFVEVIGKLNEQEQKEADPNLAVLWKGLYWRSPEFLLGQVWQIEADIAYKSLGDDTKAWEREKVLKFSQKNCALIR